MKVKTARPVLRAAPSAVAPRQAPAQRSRRPGAAHVEPAQRRRGLDTMAVGGRTPEQAPQRRGRSKMWMASKFTAAAARRWRLPRRPARRCRRSPRARPLGLSQPTRRRPPTTRCLDADPRQRHGAEQRPRDGLAWIRGAARYRGAPAPTTHREAWGRLRDGRSPPGATTAGAARRAATANTSYEGARASMATASSTRR